MHLLCRADPPIAQFKLIWIFERLSYLPRMGALTATALDSIALYGRWVYATAEVAPTEAENMVDQFNIVWNSGEQGLPHLLACGSRHCQYGPTYMDLKGPDML